MASFSLKHGCKFCHIISQALESAQSRLGRQRVEGSKPFRIGMKIFRDYYNTTTIQLIIDDPAQKYDIVGLARIFALDLASISPSRSAQKPTRDAVGLGLPQASRATTLDNLAQKYVNWDKIQQWTNEYRCGWERWPRRVFGAFFRVAQYITRSPLRHRASASSHRGVVEGSPSRLSSIYSESFRVIDVKKRCLVRGMPDDGYVALSYIWGTHPDLSMWTTTRSTVCELERKNSIIRSKTPKTIEDAMRIYAKVSQCVGVVGASLGAGIGRLEGLYGLIVDSLLSVRIMLPNTTVVEASTETNRDLFWGIRGAGWSFGFILNAYHKYLIRGQHLQA